MNIREMSARWKEITLSPPPSVPLSEREIKHPQLASFVEHAEIYSIKTIKHKEQDYEKWDKQKKIDNCPRNGASNFGIRKGFNGLAERIPHYCNHCNGCYEANTLKLKIKVEAIAERVLEERPDGQWRKKIVNDDKEAKSLKKRLKRNQGGNHLELACTDSSGKVEVWAYVESEPDKDETAMEAAYGETGDPTKDIDFDALYKKNRSTGKKLSTGSGFRKSGVAPKKSDTERVILPDILIKDISRLDEAEEIITNTNFIELAETPDKAKRLYLYQFKFLLKELKAANIEIAAIKLNFFNMSKSDILNDWNMNVQYWMSINNPQSKNSGAKVDTSRLVYPKVYKKPDSEAVQ